MNGKVLVLKMINLKTINIKYFKIFVLLSLLNLLCVAVYGSNNKIIFKLNNDAYTLLDYENRTRYLDFVGDNTELSKDLILNDFISANIFYQYYKEYFNENELEVNKIYKNILNINNENEKKYNYNIDKDNILHNIKIDLARKTILQNILNSNLEEFYASKDEIDLLYKFTINYINFESENNNIINEINNLKDINLKNVKLVLKNNGLNFFEKKQEINDINKINKNIKKNILLGKKYFVIKNENKTSVIIIKKKFETFNGIIANIFTIRSKNEINKENLKCNNIFNMKNNTNIISKQYKFSELNTKLKNNLIDINDFYKFIDNGENVYIVLCDIQFDKEILNNLNINKLINLNVEEIEKKFIKKFSKVYNLILLDV